MKLEGLLKIVFVVFLQAMILPISYALDNIPCYLNPEKQKHRSLELKQLYLDDQNDRENFEDMSDEERAALNERDLVRRKRVGEIFSEGCIRHPSDYFNAAMIFQHGDVPDHYFHAFYFADKASQSDYPGSQWLKGAAIDRYLVSINHKQLFGTQFFASQQTNWCLCLQPVELSFPIDRRKDATGKSIEDMLNEMEELNKNSGRSCPKDFCPNELKPSPIGTIPGFW